MAISGYTQGAHSGALSTAELHDAQLKGEVPVGVSFEQITPGLLRVIVNTK